MAYIIYLYMIQIGEDQNEMKEIKTGKKIFANTETVFAYESIPINCLHMFGTTIYVGTRESKLYVYEFNENQGGTFQLTHTLLPHCQIVAFITSQTKYFITIPEVEDDCNISVWDNKTKMFLTILRGHESQVPSAVFLQDESLLATCSWDGKVRIWNISNIISVTFRELKAEYPLLVIESVQKNIILYGGDDCYLNLWAIEEKDDEHIQLAKCFAHAGSVTFLYRVGKAEYFVSGGGDQKIKVWQLKEVEEENIQIQSKNNNFTEQQNEIEKPPPPKTSKYKICLIKEIKKNYDSTIYMCPLPNDSFFFIDRHSVIFIIQGIRGDSTVISEEKYPFKYDDTITGAILADNNTIVIASDTGKVQKCQFKLQKKKEQLKK